MAGYSMDNQKIAHTLGSGWASISVLSGLEILIWTNGPGVALRGWSRSGYLDQEGLKVDPGPDLQSWAILLVFRRTKNWFQDQVKEQVVA